MIKFGMMNSINGDRRYKAEDFAQFFATFIGNGIFVKPSDCLQIMGNSNSMSVIVRPGKAWVNGYYLINDEDYNLSLAVGDATLNRIDRIVIRLDFIQRKMSVEVKKGTLSASPIAPTLKRDADAYELALADVYIAKGALTINQAAITDTRLNNNLCGLMHGVVDQIDTTTLFNQYQQWFNDYSVTKASEFLAWQTNVTTALEAWIDAQEQGFEAWRQAEEQLYYTWLNGKKNDFDAWFATIRGILDEEAAGNIMNVINDHLDSPVPHKYYDDELAQPMLYGLKRNSELNTPAFVYGPTEAGPHDVINLPNYQQVEDVRRVVNDTSGVVIDVNNKKYKAVMHDTVSFKDVEGGNVLEPIGEDFAMRYPELSRFSGIVTTFYKVPLYGDFRYSSSGRFIAFYNMKTKKVISAFDLPAEAVFSTFASTNFIIDDKYVMIRTVGANGSRIGFGVFKKDTFEFVKFIGFTGSLSGFADIGQGAMPCNFVKVNDMFYYMSPTSNNNIMCFKILYDSNRVPTGIDYVRSINYSSNGVNTSIGKAMYFDGTFLYVWYTLSGNSSYMWLAKNRVNTADGSVTLSTAPQLTIYATGECTGLYPYVDKGVNYILVFFGGPSTSVTGVFNLDDQSLFQTLFSGYEERYPAIDPTSPTKIWFRRNTIWGVRINGNDFEQLYEFSYINGQWVAEIFYVPLISRINGSAFTTEHKLYLGEYSFVENGELYVRMDVDRFRKIVDAYRVSYYKEVIE